MEVSVLRIFSVLPPRWAMSPQHGPAASRTAATYQELWTDQPPPRRSMESRPAWVLPKPRVPARHSPHGGPRAGQRPDGSFSHCQGTVRGHPPCPALQLGEQVTPTLTNPKEHTVWRGMWGADASGMRLGEGALRKSSKGLRRSRGWWHSAAQIVASGTNTSTPALSACTPRTVTTETTQAGLS